MAKDSIVEVVIKMSWKVMRLLKTQFLLQFKFQESDTDVHSEEELTDRIF